MPLYHPIFQNKRNLLRWLVAVVSVAVLALGWWFYRAGQTPAQTDQSAALPDAIPDLTASSTPGPTDDVYRNAGYDTLLDLLRQKLSGSGGDVLAALAEIAQSRPELALTLAQELGRTNAEKALWVQGVLKNWTRRDPQKAWDWLTQPTNSLSSNSLVSVVMNTMATSDPGTLLVNMDKILLSKTASSGPMSAQSAVYLGLQALINNGKADFAQAAVETWAKDPLQPKFGSAAYEFVAMNLKKDSPESAATWLKSLPATDDRNAAMGTFAVSWGQSDPTAAMHWVETLAPEEGRSEVVSQVFSQWMQSDAVAAMNWLDDYIPRNTGVVEDDAMIGSMILFSPTAKNDPTEALKLADSISDPQARVIYQEQVCQSWGRTNPNAAVEYVLTSQTIPPDQKQMLIQQIREANQQAITPSQR